MSKKHVATVPGATEVIYFFIKGDSPASLLQSNQRVGGKRCGNHDAIACVLLSWDIAVTKGADKTNGRCIIAKASTTLRARVFLPRWRGRAKAAPALDRWWRSVLLQSAVHEAQHIKIQKRHLAAFREDARGKPCGSATILFNRHAKAANQAQAAFDRIEYTKPLPPLPERLRR